MGHRRTGGTLSGIRVSRRLYPHLVRLAALAAQRGIRIVWISGYRSAATQRALLSRWQRGQRSGIAVEPATYSFHLTGDAVDFYTFPRARENEVGLIAESLGLRWGGRFRNPDRRHLDIG